MRKKNSTSGWYFQRLLVVGIVVVFTPCSVFGQRFGTIQLPTYRQFSMTSSFLVPDSGRLHAGGARSASQYRDRGLRTQSVGVGSVSVSAFVHDFEALEEMVSKEAQKRRYGLPLATPKAVVESRPTIGDVSIAEARAAHRRVQAQTDARVQRDLELAKRLARKGKIAAARAILKRLDRR